MKELVAEQRVDRNGKVVTRHVSVSADDKLVSQREFPRPVIANRTPKLMARQAMVRLKDNGVDLSEASSGNSILYYLASVSPELIEKVVDDAVAANEVESKTWAFFLGQSLAPDKNTPQWSTAWLKYRHLGRRIPIATYLETTSRDSQYSHQTRNLLHLVNRVFPERADDPDFLCAASIVLHLNGENRPFKKVQQTDDYTKYVPEIEFIAEHVDEVVKLIPILRDRDTTSISVVRALLESSAVSLAEGML